MIGLTRATNPAPLPSPGTAQAISRLLGIKTKDLVPSAAEQKRRKLTGEVLKDLPVRAMQALILVLDAAIAAGGRGENFFNSMVFDALAVRWSPTYLCEIAKGPARWSRELPPTAAKRVWHQELPAAGLNFHALLAAAKDGYGLYTMSLDDGGFVVAVNFESDVWRQYEEIVGADEDYKRRRETTRLRLVLADDDLLAARRVLPASEEDWGGGWGTRKVASGYAYDVARAGKRSIEAMLVYESAVLYFDVAAFCADVDDLYASHTRILRGDFAEGRAGNTAWRRARKAAGLAWLKTDGRLSSWKAIREQLRNVEPDAWGHVAIRTRYVKVLNRRFQNVDFWLGDVPSEYRANWFRMATRNGDRLPPVGRDISSSQLWMLALVLGDTELETTLQQGSFWRIAARRLYERHPDRLVGYSGPEDEKLIESCKSAVMTLVYGSPLSEVVKRLAEDPPEYGPGLDRETLKFLVADPELNLKKCLDWYPKATRKMARVSSKMSPRRGFTFIDPYDKELVVWDPIRTKDLRIAGDSKVVIYGEVPVRRLPARVVDAHTGEPIVAYDVFDRMEPGDVLVGTYLGLHAVKVPGEEKPKWIATFKDVTRTSADGSPRDLGRLKGITGHVDRRMNLEGADFETWPKELEKRIGPCLAHSADTDFCGNVTEQLVALGVTNIVPVHDCWYVPADKAWALSLAIEAAGEPFLLEMGSLLDAFEMYVGNDANFGPEVKRMRERWQTRVDARDWPKLRSGEK